jgi:hypothetical protein
MSLEKAIKHKKEHRKPYYGKDSRNFDWSCRNHGSCLYCCDNRKFFDKKRRVFAKQDLEEVSI